MENKQKYLWIRLPKFDCRFSSYFYGTNWFSAPKWGRGCSVHSGRQDVSHNRELCVQISPNLYLMLSIVINVGVKVATKRVFIYLPDEKVIFPMMLKNILRQILPLFSIWAIQRPLFRSFATKEKYFATNKCEKIFRNNKLEGWGGINCTWEYIPKHLTINLGLTVARCKHLGLIVYIYQTMHLGLTVPGCIYLYT